MAKRLFAHQSFIPGMIMMEYALRKNAPNLEVRVLTSLVLYSEDKGYVLTSEVKDRIKTELNLKESHFRKVISNLSTGNHISVNSGVIFFAPPYLLITRCKGIIHYVQQNPSQDS